MIDIRFLRENPEAVKENIRKKFQDAKLPLVDEVVDLDAKRRAAIAPVGIRPQIQDLLLFCKKRKQIGVLHAVFFQQRPEPLIISLGIAHQIARRHMRGIE